MEKFYQLLIKNCLESGDIEKIDAKETRKHCKQILYEFRNSCFYCKGYVCQTAVKVIMAIAVLVWSLFYQCNQLRHGFRTDLSCGVSGYYHTCSIPSNGMNLIIFDLCNVTLLLILVVAVGSLLWHLRFYAQRDPNNKVKQNKVG